MAYLPGIGECFGYIEGYRYWLLRDGLLFGIGNGSGVPWVPGSAMLGKDRLDGSSAWIRMFTDTPPGVYAMREELPPTPTAEFMNVQAECEYIYGRIALWGTVVEHEKGYRAQYGYPVELIASTDQSRDMDALNFLYCGMGRPGWSERARVALTNYLAGDQTWKSENQNELIQSRQPQFRVAQTGPTFLSLQSLQMLSDESDEKSPPKQPKKPLAKFQQQVKAGKVKGYQRYWP